MATIVRVCNLALAHVGAYPIQALTDATKEAQKCSLFFGNARDEVLRAFPWNWSTKRVDLALLTSTYAGWTYAYAYPTDCLRAREIYDPTGARISDYALSQSEQLDRAQSSNSKIEFEVASDSTGDARVILCEVTNAKLIYTARITNPNMYDTMFIRSLALRLAVDLVAPLKADVMKEQQLEERYYRSIQGAQAQNANEHQKDPEQGNAFVASRV